MAGKPVPTTSSTASAPQAAVDAPTRSAPRDAIPGGRRRGTGIHGRMIARDFTRNRSVTTLLVVLMALAVMLATASAGTLVRLVGAAGDLMTQADAPHVVQLHAGITTRRQWTAGRLDDPRSPLTRRC